MAYYYWDDSFRTSEGLSLTQCLEQLGTQVVTFKAGGKRLKYKVIFLDSKKSLGNSWMLWMKDEKERNVCVTSYEKSASRVVGIL